MTAKPAAPLAVFRTSTEDPERDREREKDCELDLPYDHRYKPRHVRLGPEWRAAQAPKTPPDAPPAMTVL